MTLLNGLLSFGALAFTIPLVIHLLFRTRFRTIDWGAMHLLDNAVRVNHRRIQLLQLLLLLLRCLLPVLLAFCLARPVLTGFRSLPGDAAVTLILAIDDSRSMSARDRTGISRMARAQNMIRDLLTDLSRRDEVMLIRASQLDQPPIVAGRSMIADKLRTLSAQSGPVDLALLVRRAVEAADDATQLQRRIVVVSDFQSSDLDDSALESLGHLSDRLSERSDRPTISFLNLGVDSGELENVSIDLIEVDSPAVVAGRLATYSATIQNASDTAIQGIRIHWTADGQTIESSEVSIDTRSSTTVRIDHAFEAPGVHELATTVEHDDAIAADNRRAIGVDVIDEVRVLIADGAPSDRPLKSETDFLAVALSPFAFGGVDRSDAIRTTVIAPERISATLRDKQPNIFVLANVDRLSEKAKTDIANFVNFGGSLVIFDGESVQPIAYKGPWKGTEASWQLPAVMGQVVGSSTPQNSNPIPIEAAQDRLSPWQNLVGPDEFVFDQVNLFAYRKLVLNTVDQEQQGSSILNTSSGDPLIVAARARRGRIIQFAFPCDDAWTDLPLRAIFVPMMQQLMLDLAGSQKQTTINLGQAISVPTSELHPSVPTTSQIRYLVEHPDETETSLRPDESIESPSLSINPMIPGVYRFAAEIQSDGDPSIDPTNLNSSIRVVEISPAESKLQDADAARVEAAADTIEANVFTDSSSLRSDDRTRRYGREIWRWILGLLLIAMIVEIILQQMLSGKSILKPSKVASDFAGARP